MLKLSVDGHLRVSDKKVISIQKSPGFNLKVPLFVEKRQNKFAYELKKNKFVFN
jgi:hypothetical protein